MEICPYRSKLNVFLYTIWIHWKFVSSHHCDAVVVRGLRYHKSTEGVYNRLSSSCSTSSNYRYKQVYNSSEPNFVTQHHLFYLGNSWNIGTTACHTAKVMGYSHSTAAPDEVRNWQEYYYQWIPNPDITVTCTESTGHNSVPFWALIAVLCAGSLLCTFCVCVVVKYKCDRSDADRRRFDTSFPTAPARRRVSPSGQRSPNDLDSPYDLPEVISSPPYSPPSVDAAPPPYSLHGDPGAAGLDMTDDDVNKPPSYEQIYDGGGTPSNELNIYETIGNGAP